MVSGTSKVFTFFPNSDSELKGSTRGQKIGPEDTVQGLPATPVSETRRARFCCYLHDLVTLPSKTLRKIDKKGPATLISETRRARFCCYLHDLVTPTLKNTS